MRVLSFDEFLEEDEMVIALVDEETCPPHMRMDYATRNDNIQAGNELCSECCGTGNYFFSMYQRCRFCNGTGKQC